MRIIGLIIGGWCWIGISLSAWCQDNTVLYAQAQQAVQEKNYKVSQNLCQSILHKDVQHWDARLLLIYTYAWDDDFDQAEQLVQNFLEELAMAEQNETTKSVLLQTMLCATRLMYWQSKHTDAIERANAGLELYPEESEFLMLRGKAALADKEYEEALSSFDEVLKADPANEEAEKLRDQAYWYAAKYQAGIIYGYDIYTHSPSNRRTISAELSRFWKTFTLVGRISRSYRFEAVSQQIELESWKVLSQRWYLYSQIGYSDGILFPRFRSGLEPFYKLTSSVEVSAGFRYLKYPDQRAWIYTASATKYLGRMMLMGRTFWSPVLPGWRNTNEVGIRWFVPDEFNFVELKTGSGASPDNDYLDANFQDLRRSRSLYTIVGGQKRFTNRWLARVWFVFDRQMPTPGDNFSIISLNAGLWKRL